MYADHGSPTQWFADQWRQLAPTVVWVEWSPRSAPRLRIAFGPTYFRWHGPRTGPATGVGDLQGVLWRKDRAVVRLVASRLARGHLRGLEHFVPPQRTSRLHDCLRQPAIAACCLLSGTSSSTSRSSALRYRHVHKGSADVI